MLEGNLYPELIADLHKLKEASKEPMNRLRNGAIRRFIT